MSRPWSGPGVPVSGMTRPAREAHPPLLSVSSVALPQLRAALPHFCNARGAPLSKSAMNLAHLGRRPVLGHEKRHLMALIEIIEVHKCSVLASGSAIVSQSRKLTA